MKITSNTNRTVELEDGPIVSAGPDYHDGTFFRVEKVRSAWADGEQPTALRLIGKRCDDKGQPVIQSGYHFEHERGLFVSELRGDADLQEIASMFNTEED